MIQFIIKVVLTSLWIVTISEVGKRDFKNFGINF